MTHQLEFWAVSDLEYAVEIFWSMSDLNFWSASVLGLKDCCDFDCYLVLVTDLMFCPALDSGDRLT